MVISKIKAALLGTAVLAATAVLAFDMPETTGEQVQTLYWFETLDDGTPTQYIGTSASGDCPDNGLKSCERAYLEDQVEFDVNGEPTGVISTEVDQPEDQQNRE